MLCTPKILCAMDEQYEVSSTPPTEDEYKDLRNQAAPGWPLEKDETPIEDACYSITVRNKDTQGLAGFGSIQLTHDGKALEFYDLLVMPDDQSNGIGSKITDSIIEWSREYVDQKNQPWIALRGKAARGRNSYFERFGFETTNQDENKNEIRKKIHSTEEDT